MKAIFVTLLIVLSNSIHAQSKHVILISIDGLRPEMYLDKKWPTPNLQYLMKQGVYAHHMTSVFPAYTYPSHTAMLTGALPARSGITHNVKDDQGNWFWFTKDIRTTTLWQALKANGMTSAAVQWPVSVSGDITWNMPEIWDPEHPEDRITATRKYATPGLIAEIEQHATGTLTAENMSEEYFSLDENAARSAAYIFKTKKPHLFAVHFALLDGMEHGYGRTHDSVTLAIAMIDRCIGGVIEAIERSGLRDSTTVIIVGDHGFSDIKQVLRPNVWINNVKARFQTAGGSAFLHADHPAATQQVQDMLKNLPVTYKKLFSVYDRKRLAAMGADSSATLALAAVPGIVFSGATTGDQLTPVKGGHHGYDPNLPDMYTGFIASGAGIKKGAAIKALCVTDIAPLIATLLGIAFKVPDGKLVDGIVR